MTLATTATHAAAGDVTPVTDVAPIDIYNTADSVTAPHSFKQRVSDFFSGKSAREGIVPRPGFSIIGGPHYDTESKLGLGIVASSQFRLHGCDSAMQLSNISMTADVSTAGFVSLGAKGHIFFPRDDKRLLADMQFAYSPTYFWGIGYDNGNDDDNETKMRKIMVKVRADFLWRLAPGLYAGPLAQWQYTHSREIDRPDLLEGQDRTVKNLGVGFTVDYDTRDYITSATRGVYVHYSQLFCPIFLWNTYHYTMTDLRLSYYHKAWKGAVIAGEARLLMNFGKPSWATMALLGDQYSMRGYYPARYRDKHLTAAQVEIRQHIYGPIGAVVWGGAGTVFHDSDTFKSGWLPNYGLGLRWAFRPHVNIRLDYGFGKKGQNGFMFAINEAF